jgi:hypothetical protein
MASLPGMPGSLGMPGGTGFQSAGNPSGSDLSLDLPTLAGDSFGAWPLVVNKTVVHWLSPFGPDDGHGGELPATLSFPPTTEGNTLVIVQNSLWGPDYPRFNGKTAGWDDSANFTPNDQFSGIFGGSGLPDPPGSPQNAGSLIAYFTNVPGGLSTISYGDVVGHKGAPEWTAIYELTPSIVVDGNPKYIPIDEDNFSNASPFLNVPVDGPIDATGIYFAGMSTAGTSADFFVSTSFPWVIDEQDAFGLTPSKETGIGAVAIIYGGAGTQQAAWDGGSANHGFVSSSISLVNFSTSGGGGGADLNQFLPNVWIVS